MTNETGKKPLADIIRELLAAKAQEKPKAKPVAKPPRNGSTPPAANQPTEREIRISRLISAKWREEKLILLVTRSRCECGELYTSPAPRMFIRRFHPQFGIHLEPLVVRPRSPLLAISPPEIEYVDEEISICHRCLPQRTDAAIAEVRQIQFDFSETVFANLPFMKDTSNV